MSTHKYETLLKIVELGNITKAAELLGYSQSAISHVVSSLENDWNVKLLIRDRQGVRLTREGEELMPTIERIVGENKRLMRQVSELQNLEQGTIHIGTFFSTAVHLVPKLVTSFMKKYPHIRFQVSHGGYRDLEQRINSGNLDCGFVCLPTTANFDVIPLFRDRVLAVLPEDSDYQKDRFSIEDIGEHTLIVQKEMDYEVVDMFKKYNVKVDQLYFSDYDYSILPMVATGFGMSLLPELMLQDSPYKLSVKELDPPAFRNVAIGYHREYATPATKKFIKHVTEYFKENTPTE